MSRPLSVVIAGGGTGGHLFPGIAVAKTLVARRPGARVAFAGTARGLEARVVPQEGFDLDLIRSAGLKGKSVGARLRGLAMLPLGAVDAWRLLSRRRPDVVVGVGGYSSGPVVLLAALRGVATMVLEQNAVPGLTNRWLAPFVRAAAVTYPETLRYFRGRGVVAGNPVRPEFLAPVPPVARREGSPTLLILGGSQGAQAINAAMADAAVDLAARLPSLQIVHQAGARDVDRLEAAYTASGLSARVVPFLDAMADHMRTATVVLSRAGATTLAELAAVGTAAILVPLPTATDDHQRRNADVFVQAGAAVVIEQASLSAPEGRRHLIESIASIVDDPARRDGMAARARTLARPDAAETIVGRLLELAA